MWKFSFEIILTDRSFELYSPTRVEREKWVHVFKLLLEMQKKSISTRSVSPFGYAKYKELMNVKNEHAQYE